MGTSITKIEELVGSGNGIVFDIDYDSWMRKPRPEKEPVVEFYCLCGSCEYISHSKSNGILGPGGSGWITHFECAGCSNVFQNLEKYTKAQKTLVKRLRDIVRVLTPVLSIE
jgi:transposase-like protein